LRDGAGGGRSREEDRRRGWGGPNLHGVRRSTDEAGMTASDDNLSVSDAVAVGYRVYWRLGAGQAADEAFHGPLLGRDGTPLIAPLGTDDLLVGAEELPRGEYLLVPVDEHGDRVPSLPRVLVAVGDEPPPWVRDQEHEFVVGAIER